MRKTTPVQKKGDCEIEIKQTKHGKRIRISGECTKSEIEAFTKKEDIEVD